MVQTRRKKETNEKQQQQKKTEKMYAFGWMAKWYEEQSGDWVRDYRKNVHLHSQR